MSTLVLTLFAEEWGLLQSSPAPAVKGLWPQAGTQLCVPVGSKGELGQPCPQEPQGQFLGFTSGGRGRGREGWGQRASFP